MKKRLVTSALPYANGPIHLGHLVEYIQTDIWVRGCRARGKETLYVCGEDAHGTPVMVRAKREGIRPEDLVDRMHQEHLRDFQQFQIQFDRYYTTHSEENRELCLQIYSILQKRGYLVQRE